VRDHETVATELTKRDLAYFLFKRKREILGIFAGTLAISAIGTYLAPRNFVASATVYVVRNLPPIANAGPTSMNIVLDRREVLNSEVDLITSNAVAEQVADNLIAQSASAPKRPKKEPSALVKTLRSARERVSGFFIGIGLTDPPPPPREGLITSLQQAVEAKPAVNSDFITVAGTAEDPEYAALMVNTFTKVYLERRLALFKRPGLEDFYETQIQRVRSTMEDLDRQIATLKTGTGVVSQDEQLRLKLQELSGLNNELNRVQSEVQELQERQGSLQARIQSQPDTITASRVLQRNPAVIDLEKKAVDLEAEKASELNRFQQDSPVIQELDRSIKRLQEAASKEEATVVNSESVVQNSVRTTLLTDLYRTESDYKAKRTREKALLAQISELAREIQKVDSNATELRRLAAAAASASKIYATYVEQREEARIATQSDHNVTNVQVINEAKAPTRPKYPRILLIGFGGVLGLLMGLAVAFASQLFSHTLDRREDVERELGLPVLAAMPISPEMRRPI
jgi:uncharacterized protein involved in exopolysaccharide biosynthesis